MDAPVEDEYAGCHSKHLGEQDNGPSCDTKPITIFLQIHWAEAWLIRFHRLSLIWIYVSKLQLEPPSPALNSLIQHSKPPLLNDLVLSSNMASAMAGESALFVTVCCLLWISSIARLQYMTWENLVGLNIPDLSLIPFNTNHEMFMSESSSHYPETDNHLTKPHMIIYIINEDLTLDASRKLFPPTSNHCPITPVFIYHLFLLHLSNSNHQNYHSLPSVLWIDFNRNKLVILIWEH